ncbi:MAG: hypothetical protein GYA55_10550, partial [SAR324 cluster bacterium]|nr:hypothetical protein [SAR324 cluster bacterium]
MTNSRTLHRSRRELMTVLVISLILILCPLSQSVFAGVSEIRKNVLENCPKAISEFNSLTEIDKKSLIPYLELVLGLEAGASVPHVLSPPAIASQQVPFLGRSGRSLGEDLVHSVEPVRELEAKRCAVNLLEKCQVSAFEAVPELIKLSFDKTLPFDFQEQIEDAIWSITLSASRQNVCPAIEAQLENLFRLLTENEDTSLPANVFIQTGDCSVGYVLDILPITDDALSGRCIDILRNIDEAGNIIGPRFLDYLQSKDMALRRMALRVLGTLKAYYPRSVVPILKLLKEGASDLEPELLNTLRAYFREPGLISEHPQRDEISGLLIDLVAALPESERGVIQEGLKQLKSFPPVIRDRLKVMTDAPDATLRKMALMLLGQGADKEDFN